MKVEICVFVPIILCVCFCKNGLQWSETPIFQKTDNHTHIFNNMFSKGDRKNDLSSLDEQNLCCEM